MLVAFCCLPGFWRLHWLTILQDSVFGASMQLWESLHAVREHTEYPVLDLANDSILLNRVAIIAPNEIWLIGQVLNRMSGITVRI